MKLKYIMGAIAVIMLVVALYLLYPRFTRPKEACIKLSLETSPKAIPGMNVTLTVVVKNIGSKSAHNVTVIATPLSEYLEISAYGGSSEANKHHLAILEPGGERILSYTVHVSKNAYPGKYGIQISVLDQYMNTLTEVEAFIEIIETSG